MKAPYVIAECGVAHEGSLERAVQMIQEIAAAGGNAAKFQCYKAGTLASKNAPTYFQQDGNPAATQHEFFSRYDSFERADYEYLAQVCTAAGIDFGCTVFTPEDVAWVDPFVKWHKIASADITNVPLLEAIGRTRKPVLLSTGASTWEEIGFARAAATPGTPPKAKATLLHCVLSYPTPHDAASLGVIAELRDLSQSYASDFIRGAVKYDNSFDVGYSDHTLFNLDVLTTAWLLGASVIEKHYTWDKTLPGNDHYHSMDQHDLAALVAKFTELQAMIGDGEKRVLPIEEPARLYARRSWHAVQALAAGHVIAPGDFVPKRPGTGVPPTVDPVGQTLAQALVPDQILMATDLR